MDYPFVVKQSVGALSRLPGIGEKTALRLVMAMMKWQPGEIDECSSAISGLSNIKYCRDCGLFCEEDFCSICTKTARNESQIICVVENVNDLMAIEKSNEYKGLYHILGGVLNPLAGIGPQQLKMEKLVERVKRLNIQSLILAINPSVEGDATCAYIKNVLQDFDVEVQRIGFGIPMGGNLEFLDPMTISKALENRKSL